MASSGNSRMKVGVVLPMAEDVETGQTPPYTEIRARALQAEAAGFDAIWLFDHLLFRFPDKPTAGVWEAWTLLCALAEATERVTLGTIVLCTAFRNPAVLAKMAATLDEISNGRLILGLGSGWHQPEFDAFGISFNRRVDRFEEALKIIVPLLREGEVDFQGTYYQAPKCEIRPRGPSKGGPPLLVASKGPRMLRLTARYADAWNTAWLGQPGALATRRADLETACAEEGRDPADIEVTVGVSLRYPVPGKAPIEPTQADDVLTGSPEVIAHALRAYEQLGVGHAICSLDQDDAAALDWLAEALKVYRGM